MTITKAEILTHLNAELNRSETDIDAHILQAMKDLSLADEFVWVETTVPTIIGRTYYSLPTDYKRLMTIKVSDNTPLEKISWQYYQELIADQTSANRGEPDYFAIHGGFWYPYPTPDAIYTVTLFYNAFILESESEVNAVDNIDGYYTDIYRKALYDLTKAHYLLSKGLKEDAADYLNIFRSIDLPPLQKLIEREVRSIDVQDV
jgi:hypothetical protein